MVQGITFAIGFLVLSMGMYVLHYSYMCCFNISVRSALPMMELIAEQSIVLLGGTWFQLHSLIYWMMVSCSYESLFVSVTTLTKEGPRGTKILKILRSSSTFLCKIEPWTASPLWSLCWLLFYWGLFSRSSSLLVFIIQMINPVPYLSISLLAHHLAFTY